MKSKHQASQKQMEISDNNIPDYDHLFEQDEVVKRKHKKGFFGKILSLNKVPLVTSTLFCIIMQLPVWLIPVLTANIINAVTGALTSGVGITSRLWQVLIINASIMLILIVQNVPSTILRWRITSKMIRRTSAGVKSAVVRKLQSLSITYHKNMQTGKVQSKFLKDTESIDGLFFNLLQGLIPNILTVLVAVGISLYTNWKVALFFLIIVPCNVILSRIFSKKLKKNYRDYRIKTEAMSAKMSTMLSMMTVTKAHGLEDKQIASLNESISDLVGSGRKVDRVTAHFGSWAFVIPTLFNVTCVVFCSIMAMYGYINVGDIVLYQSMFSQISGSVSSLVHFIPTFSSGIESLSSVSELMNVKDIEASINKSHVGEIEGKVEFKNVYYCYPETNQYVVNNLSLSIEKGECIAVVGSSGSGKTTIMNMIIGFLLPTKGSVLIDGKSINSLNLSEYRKNISVVTQNNILFSGSIRENITYGLDDYTEEQLNRVLEMANINEFLKDLPNGLDTNIGEYGDKLSGGQKQRITIARALIRDPKILILDEATSALDNISEYNVQKAISSSIRGRTTFIVAHRLSTIRDADRIVVMEHGFPVEIGTYEELINKKGKFYELKNLNEVTLMEAEKALS